MNRKIENKEINPMIIVCPDSKNKYLGSFHTNSQVTGQWEDFIIQDVVSYMDKNYRTIAYTDGRGIAGYSMGGYGAIKLAMKHPSVFCAAYALSPAPACFQDVVMGTLSEFLIQAVLSDMDGYDVLPSPAKMLIACAAAFAPNPNLQPFYGELPVTESGAQIDSTWKKWLAHDLSLMIPEFKDSLLSLQAIQFDCGTSDHLYFNSNKSFSRELNSNDVEHGFEEYDGDHFNKISERIDENLIPFFSEILDHE